MHFGDPKMFHFFWFALALILFLLWAKKRYKQTLARFVKEDLLPVVAPSYRPQERGQRIILLAITLVFTVFALARPQWGFEWQEVKRKGIDLLIVVDTSKSMLTQDVKPNRLERTKLAVEDLLKKLKGDRIGLIAFAGDAFLLCPLTVDYDGFRLSLDDLSTHSVPRGGTDIAAAIREALRHYEKGSENYRAIIVVTDGDNLEGDPLAAAQEAKAKGVKIYTIGIGTKEGDLIQVRGADGKKEFLKDSSGNYVKSRLNERLLQQIALETGGVYVKSSGAEFGLDLIYERELSHLQKREFESQKQKRYFERFQIPLSIALLFLLLETCWRRKKKSSSVS